VVVRKGETVDSEEIMAYCKTRLAGFKRPASVIFIDVLPRNPLGKVLKKELKETYGKG
jgi:acyl-CoA synthetase (AMP-forming)/AMP-acid ligase II